MPGVPVENSLVSANRMHDITSWQEGDIALMNAKEKKRYHRRKSALAEYFTTSVSIDEITRRYHLPEKLLLQLAEQCFMQHEDGKEWGFRALVPGADVIDHTSHPASQDVPSQEEVPQAEISEAAAHTISKDAPGHISTEPDQAMVGEDAPGHISTEPEPSTVDIAVITGEGDTEKRQAVTLPFQSSPFDLEVPETPPTPGNDDEEQDIAREEPTSKLTREIETPVEDEPLAVQTTEPIPPEELVSPKPATTEVEAEQAPVAAENLSPEAEAPATAEEPVPATVDEQENVLNVESITHPPDRVLAVALPTAITPSLDIVSEETQPLVNNNMQVTVPPGSAPIPLMPQMLPRLIKRRRFVTGNKALQRRIVRKRWMRGGAYGQQKKKHHQTIVSLSVLAALVLFVIMPVSVGFAAYGAYSNIRGLAFDGVNHLLKVKTILPVSKSDPTAALNPDKLKEAQDEFNKAESDFVQLQQLVDRPDVQALVGQFAPEYSTKLVMSQRLVQVALDVSRMGSEMTSVALIGANIIHGHGSPLASDSNKPLLTAANIAAIEGSLVHANYYINDIRSQMSQVSLKDVPISDSQKKQLASALALLPQAEDAVIQAQGLISTVSWLLGIGQPRRFLVQTMDRAELRPGGGFTGQYGILQVQDGRMAPLNLRDVTLIDYAGNGTAMGRTAPPGYSWMNFGNWGIRDSNLSGDFPTTARMTMQLFQDEGGGPVDGDIAFTPALIAHILYVTGPIQVPGYNETITPQNLEERLHYYQQDYSAIAREKQISGDYSHAGRKAFTSTLGKLLLDRVRHLSVSKLVDLLKGALKDIQSRDLEIYFSNPTAEAWLIEHGYSGSIDTFTKQDGFIVVQANISISKASQYVHTTEHDDITLDAQGGATHHLTITLDYQQKGPVYGYDTYADYIRVYAPPSAQFISGDGFDTGHALCTPGTPPPTAGPGGTAAGCGNYNSSFPSDARYCPNGNYSLGIRGVGSAWPVDELGPPTSHTSDLPGRQMWGGLTETPKNCISTISLSWYVPHEVKNIPGQSPYTLLVQKQGGYIPGVEITVDTSALKGLQPLSYKGNIAADTFISSPPLKKT